MTAKVRVKDLAAELGLSNKEILQHLRSIGVQVKSHMSVVEEDEMANLKSELKNEGGNTEVVRREVQPGVIVRRRRKTDKVDAASEEPEMEEDAIIPDDSEIDEVEEQPVVEPVQEEPVAKTPEKKSAPAKRPAKTEPQVRIIAPAKSEPAPTQEPEPEPQPEPVVEAPAPAKEKPVAKPDVQEEPVAEPVADGPEAAAPAADTDQSKGDAKKKKKKKKEPIAPKVKIISLPDPNEVRAREVARTLSETAPPRRPRPPRPTSAAPAAQTPAPGAPSDDPRKKKRKKDRRVVEFGGHRDQQERSFGAPNEQRGKKGRKRGKSQQQIEVPSAVSPMKAAKRKIKVDEAIRLSDMAHQMGIKAQDLIKTLFGMGVMATINQSLDMDTATLVASEFGYEVENVSFDEQDFLVDQATDKQEDLKPRPPVVTIMGHVDHGKTSLLDAIRLSNVTAGEAGGITQHIGAYHVATNRGEIVFLDTPGHEAFTTMRMRGAQVTDIVILVVAADDGVMDQTREAISHSKAAGVPIVVAVNKIDKEGANPDNVKRELAELGLSPEEWGGETIFAHVSAKQKIGLDELLEMVLLQAEVLELKANPDKPARGHIVEAKLDKGRGPVGTMLISEGTLRQGDSFICGVQFGKVRAMFNDQGKKIKSAGPAIPVEIQGFDGIPQAGDEFMVVSDEKVARRISQSRQMKQRERILAGQTKVTLESFLASRPDDEAQTLNLVLKADVQGSLEAVTEALNKLSTDEVKINVVHGGAGAITESDILLAGASQAIIIGFNVRPNLKVKEIAEHEGVEVRFYDIIYKLVSEVKDAMSGMLAPDIEEVYLGQAEVRETFSVPKVGTVAGCYVADGKITRNAKVRLLRGGVVIHTGKLASLKRFKDDAKEVTKGFECGMGIERFNDIKIGDFFEAFEEKEVARTID